MQDCSNLMYSLMEQSHQVITNLSNAIIHMLDLYSIYLSISLYLIQGLTTMRMEAKMV